MTVSPAVAARHRTTNTVNKSNELLAARSPVSKIRELPEKKRSSHRPVSQKTIATDSKYVNK